MKKRYYVVAAVALTLLGSMFGINPNVLVSMLPNESTPAAEAVTNQ